MLKRARVLVLGHARSPTGFGRVLNSLLYHLADKYDVHHFGPNYRGEVLDGRWRTYPNRMPIDVLGSGTLKALAEELDPDLILLFHDPWPMSRYLVELGRIRPRAKIVAYIPVDARILAPQHLGWVSQVDVVVTYTGFGRRTIEDCLGDLQIQADVRVIPHGTSTDLFYPLNGQPGVAPQQIRARRELAPLLAIPEDSFVVLNASRNQPRKRIDLTITGFALFARDKPPQVRLLLHMGRNEIGWNVLTLAAEAGVRERVIISGHVMEHPAFPDHVLNLIYNASDVGVNTAAAEAWGLASFEHAATGAPQLVPGHGGCAEIWDAHAVLLKPVARQHLGSALEASIVSPEQLATELEALYACPEHRLEMGRAAYSNATKLEYHWSHIANVWSDLFDELTS